MAILTNKPQSAFFFILISCMFSLKTMNEALMMEQATKQVSLCFESLKDILVIPEDYSTLQTLFFSLKDLSTKTFEICYAHPKLCLGGTTITLGLIALRKSGYWPITKKELWNLKKNSIENLLLRTDIFKRNTTTYSQKRSQELGTIIDLSNGRITLVNNTIEAVGVEVDALPNFVMSVGQQATESLLRQQGFFLLDADVAHQRTISEAYSSLVELLEKNGTELSDKFGKMVRVEKEINKQRKEYLQEIIDQLTEQSENSTVTNNFFYEKQREQFAAIDVQHNQLASRIASLLDECKGLEATVDPSIFDMLEEQEDIMTYYKQLTQN